MFIGNSLRGLVLIRMKKRQRRSNDPNEQNKYSKSFNLGHLDKLDLAYSKLFKLTLWEMLGKEFVSGVIIKHLKFLVGIEGLDSINADSYAESDCKDNP